MDFSKLCSEILKLDDKVRYAGVYNTTSGKVFEKMREGTKRLLDKEQSNNSVIHAYMRWKIRQQYSEFIGEPIYSMTKYTKVNRITLPCSRDSLLLISTEPDLEPHEIIDDVLKLIEKLSDDPNYAPRTPQLNF